MFEIGVVDVFENESRSSRDWVLDDALQGDDVSATSQVFQDLDLPLNLLLFH